MITLYKSFTRTRVCLCVFVSITAGLFVVGTCNAAEDAAQMKLSLADAIKMALDINPSLKQAEENAISSKSRLRVAAISTTFDVGTNATMLHSPSDSARSGRLFGQYTAESQKGTRMSLDLTPFGSGNDRGAVGLSLRQPLLKGRGQYSNRYSTLAGARSDATIQEKQLYITRQSHIQQVISAYFRAVQAREEVKVQERALVTAQSASDGAIARAAEQEVTEIEVARAKMQVVQTQDQLNNRKQSAQGSLDQLMIAIGDGVGKTPELVDTVPEMEFKTPTLPEAIKIALENRSELQIYDLQLADQQRILSERKDKLKPSLDVVAGFNSTNPDGGIISSSLYNLGALTAGIEYRLPMDKRSLQEDLSSSARSLDILKKMQVFQMEQVAESVRNAYRSLEASKTSVGILAQNLQVAKDNLELAQMMLDEGLDDNRNVIEGQQSLTQAENGLLSAKLDMFMAYVNLKYAMGEDLAQIALVSEDSIETKEK